MKWKNKLILVLALIGLLVSLALVLQELNSPCYCPSYPLLGIPACYVVCLYFLMIILSFTISNYDGILFWVGSVGGILTAVWFSIHQFLDLVQCPKFLTVPLCFVALATFLSIILLKISIDHKRDQQHN